MAPVATQRAVRERTSTRIFSWYWFVWRRIGCLGCACDGSPPPTAVTCGWRRCPWESVEMGVNVPTSGGKVARARKGDGPHLESLPGIYEFAISKPGSSKRFKVYCGYSSNIRQRHDQYRNNGSHLRSEIGFVRSRGLTLWRRIRYTKDKETAKLYESALLSRYDYSWNKMENGRKRTIDLEVVCCCCVKPTTVPTTITPKNTPKKPTKAKHASTTTKQNPIIATHAPAPSHMHAQTMHTNGSVNGLHPSGARI